MSVLHLLNLDTMGGVEELFVNFLACAKKLDSSKQHVLVTGKRPHPFFQAELALADSITLERYIGAIKLPRFLRTLKRKVTMTRCQPTTCILWNRLEKLSCPGRLIYYEHGASWITPQGVHTKEIFENVDLVLANSHAAIRLLELKWGVQKPIELIENPLKPSVQPALQPKKASKKLTLGYVGRLIPLKGVSLLLHALQYLDLPLELKVAGAGPEEQALKMEAKRLNLPVTFCGVVKDVAGFYDSIDILVVPSIREPLGLVAQEAALRGCPVIAANVDGLPEVVRHNQTGFLISPTLSLDRYHEFGGSQKSLPDLVYDPDSDSLITPRLIDPTHIAHAIRTLATNPTLFEAMSRNSIAFALTRPNFVQYTQKLLSYFLET